MHTLSTQVYTIAIHLQGICTMMMSASICLSLRHTIQYPASHSCSSAKQCTVTSNGSHGKRSAQSMSHHFELQNLFRAHGPVCDSNQSCLSVICFWSVWSVLHIDASSFHTHLVLACFRTKKVQKVCHRISEIIRISHGLLPHVTMSISWSIPWAMASR